MFCVRSRVTQITSPTPLSSVFTTSFYAHKYPKRYSPFISVNMRIPPLPPYLLHQSNQSSGPRRRLLDIIPSPPHLPIPISRIPRPSTLMAKDDGKFRNRPTFMPRLKSQSLDTLYHQTDEIAALDGEMGSMAAEERSSETDGVGEEETGNEAPVNPVPLALWSALHVASIAPLFLDCNVGTPSHPYPVTAPQSASFARVTFSPLTRNELEVSSRHYLVKLVDNRVN